MFRQRADHLLIEDFNRQRNLYRICTDADLSRQPGATLRVEFYHLAEADIDKDPNFPQAVKPGQTGTPDVCLNIYQVIKDASTRLSARPTGTRATRKKYRDALVALYLTDNRLGSEDNCIDDQQRHTWQAFVEFC